MNSSLISRLQQYAKYKVVAPSTASTRENHSRLFTLRMESVWSRNKILINYTTKHRYTNFVWKLLEWCKRIQNDNADNEDNEIRDNYGRCGDNKQGKVVLRNLIYTRLLHEFVGRKIVDAFVQSPSIVWFGLCNRYKTFFPPIFRINFRANPQVYYIFHTPTLIYIKNEQTFQRVLHAFLYSNSNKR